MPDGATPPAGAAAAEAAALSGVLPDLAASTSDLTTRPFGPEPEIAESSIAASLARRLASGEANTRPPSDFAGALEPVLLLATLERALSVALARDASNSARPSSDFAGAGSALAVGAVCVAALARSTAPASVLGASLDLLPPA